MKQAAVPWSEPGSGFTLWFEALVVALAREMPVRAVARLVGEHDTRLWRLLKRRVGEARADVDFSGVRAVAVDETACRRGHDYITLFADLDRSRLLYATPGRDASVVCRFREDLEARGGRTASVRDLCMDMSTAYMKGAREAFPEGRHHLRPLPRAAGHEPGGGRGEAPRAPRAEPHPLPMAQEAEQAHRLSAALDRRTARSVAAGTEDGPRLPDQARLRGVLGPAAPAGGDLPQEVVLVGRRKRPPARHRRGEDHQEALGRHPPLGSAPGSATA